MPRPHDNQMDLFGFKRLKLHVEDEQVMDAAGKVYDVRQAIDAIPWVSAVKYPPPHQYVTLQRCPIDPWDIVAAAIGGMPDSYLAYFRGYQRPNRYWEFEGRRYWRTASAGPGGVTQMLNRALFESSEPPRRVDEGAKPVPPEEWNALPWDLQNQPPPNWYVRQADGSFLYVEERDPYLPRNRRRMIAVGELIESDDPVDSQPGDAVE